MSTYVTEPSPTSADDDAAPESNTFGSYLRWVLAAFSAGAAGIHFAYAPDHFNETWYAGTFFIVIAWLELLYAVAIVVKPKRWIIGAGVALSLGTIAVWVVSRTVGVPIGPMAGNSEPVAFPDALCTFLEAGVAVGGLLWLFKPSLMERKVRSVEFAAAVASAFAVAAILVASAGVSPSMAGDHNHSEAAEGGAHEAGSHDAAGAAHDDGATATAAHDDVASHDATGTGSHDMASMASATPWKGDSPCEEAGPATSPGQAQTDAEGHDHRGPLKQQPVTAEDRATLEEQQKVARGVADRYPTVKDAEAAGYHLSTVYLPCIGAHYTKESLVGKFDPANPSELLYDGTKPDSKIVGLSFLLFHPGGAPEGFAGPNDVWHQHSFNGGLCLNPQGVVIGGEKDTDKQCEAKGGKKAALKDIWMVHDWIVPGWECTWGVFAAECPELGGRINGTAADAPDANSKAATDSGSDETQAADKPGG